MPLEVTIPDEILHTFPRSEGEPRGRVLKSVVAQLYREGRISAGKVADLMGMSRIEADHFLAGAGVSMGLTLEEHERDVANIESMLSH